MEEDLACELHDNLSLAPEKIQPRHLKSVRKVDYNEEHSSSLATNKPSSKKVHFEMDEEETKMDAEGSRTEDEHNDSEPVISIGTKQKRK